MGNQLNKEFNVSENVVFKGGCSKVYDVYSGVHKESKEQVSIWRCRIPPLKQRFKGDWEFVYDALIKEIDFLCQFENSPKNKYYLTIHKKFVTKNELIFVSEPVMGSLEDWSGGGKNFQNFSKIEYELKFNYLYEGVRKLHKIHQMRHNNISKESILISAKKKYFKLFGFYFFSKKGEKTPYEKIYRSRFKPSFLKKHLELKMREKFDSVEFDVLQFTEIVEDVMKRKINFEDKTIVLLKKIIEEEEGIKKIPDINQFYSQLYHSSFSTDIFIQYCKNYLLNKIHFKHLNSVEFLLPIFFKFIPTMTKEQYSKLIMPKLKVVFNKNYFKNVKIPLLLLNKIEMFLNYSNEVEKKNVLYPFINNCLDSNHSDIQFEVLRKSEVNVNNGLIDSQFFVKTVLPRIITLVRITNFPNVKLNSIVCIGKVINLLKKEYLITNILPILKYSIRNEKSSVTIMTIVGVYSRIARILDVKIIATNILPNILPLVVSNKLKRDEFLKFMKVINKLVERIGVERLKHFDDLEQFEREKKLQQEKSQEFPALPKVKTQQKTQRPAPPQKVIPPAPPKHKTARKTTLKVTTSTMENFDFIVQAKKKTEKKKARKSIKNLGSLDLDILDDKNTPKKEGDPGKRKNNESIAEMVNREKEEIFAGLGNPEPKPKKRVLTQLQRKKKEEMEKRRKNPRSTKNKLKEVTKKQTALTAQEKVRKKQQKLAREKEEEKKREREMMARIEAEERKRQDEEDELDRERIRLQKEEDERERQREEDANQRKEALLEERRLREERIRAEAEEKERQRKMMEEQRLRPRGITDLMYAPTTQEESVLGQMGIVQKIFSKPNFDFIEEQEELKKNGQLPKSREDPEFDNLLDQVQVTDDDLLSPLNMRTKMDDSDDDMFKYSQELSQSALDDVNQSKDDFGFSASPKKDDGGDDFDNLLANFED